MRGGADAFEYFFALKSLGLIRKPIIHDGDRILLSLLRQGRRRSWDLLLLGLGVNSTESCHNCWFGLFSEGRIDQDNVGPSTDWNGSDPSLDSLKEKTVDQFASSSLLLILGGQEVMEMVLLLSSEGGRGHWSQGGG